MTDQTSPLLFSIDQGVARLTFNRPEAHHALDHALLAALENAFESIRQDALVRVVVMRGDASAFMAGSDVPQLAAILDTGHSAPTFGQLLDRMNRLIQNIRNLPQPVVAVVEGPCTGFGVSLMLAADLVIAAQTARFTLAFDRLGISPDGGATWQLVRTLGLKRAYELIVLGDDLDAKTAMDWGLINAAVRPEEIEATVTTCIARLQSGAVEAQMRVKQLLNNAADAALAAQLEAEAESFLQLSQSADFKEGLMAFLERRPPVFRGN